MIRNFSLSLSPSLKCLKISILTRRTRARRVSVALKAPRESLRRRHKIRPLKTVKRGAVGSLTRRMHSNPGCSKSLFSNRSLYVSIRSFEAFCFVSQFVIAFLWNFSARNGSVSSSRELTNELISFAGRRRASSEK